MSLCLLILQKSRKVLSVSTFHSLQMILVNGLIRKACSCGIAAEETEANIRNRVKGVFTLARGQNYKNRRKVKYQVQ